MTSHTPIPVLLPHGFLYLFACLEELGDVLEVVVEAEAEPAKEEVFMKLERR